jgi:hypothetical protein
MDAHGLKILGGIRFFPKILFIKGGDVKKWQNYWLMFSLQTSFRKEIILGPLLRPNPFFFLKRKYVTVFGLQSKCSRRI